MNAEKINLSTQSFVNLVEDYLQNKQSLSVIRYGDGESMMFNDNPADTAFILKKVLGYVPTQSEIVDITINLVKAYQECDIIGIPTEKHLARQDNWAKSVEHFKRKVGEGTLISKNKTSIDIFYDMLKDDCFTKLFSSVDSVSYISCRDLDNRFKDKFSITNINKFIISPEPTYTSGYKGLKHYPEQFNLIREWIKGLGDLRGQLCLVGAGIPGKIYNNWFRNQGGVSLDIGSVFDGFAGFKTRGAGRGLDVIDETNKL